MWDTWAPALRTLGAAEVALKMKGSLSNTSHNVPILVHMRSGGRLIPKASRIAISEDVARPQRVKDKQDVTAAVFTLVTYVSDCATLLRPSHRACRR